MISFRFSFTFTCMFVFLYIHIMSIVGVSLRFKNWIATDCFMVILRHMTNKDFISLNLYVFKKARTKFYFQNIESILLILSYIIVWYFIPIKFCIILIVRFYEPYCWNVLNKVYSSSSYYQFLFALYPRMYKQLSLDYTDTEDN